MTKSFKSAKSKKSSKKSITCPICLDKLGKKNVVIFPCHHTHKIHFNCFLRMRHYDKKCPYCRKLHTLPRNTESPDDFISFLRFMSMHFSNNSEPHFSNYPDLSDSKDLDFSNVEPEDEFSETEIPPDFFGSVSSNSDSENMEEPIQDNQSI